MRVVQSGHISYLFIMVRDLKTMMAFYRDVLGFFITHFEEDTCAFLTLPGEDTPQLALYIGREDEAVANCNHWFIVVDVDDLDEAAARAHSMNVGTEGLFDVPYGRALKVTDPEGNVIQLHQPHRSSGH